MTAKNAAGRRLGSLLIAVFAVAALVAPASALADPVLKVSSSHYPPGLPSGTSAQYTLIVSNTGTTNTTGDPTVTFTVPAGLKITAVTDEVKQLFGSISAWGCSVAGDAQSVSCTGPILPGFGSLPIEPGKEACEGAFGGAIPSCRIFVTAKAETGLQPQTLTPTVEACGGGAVACANASDPTDIVPFEFRLTSFDLRYLEENGDPETQAASHPYTTTNDFSFSTALNPQGQEIAVEDLKDATVNLPPGLLGDPQAYPTCTEEQLTSPAGAAGNCPAESQVGTVNIWLDFNQGSPGHPVHGTPGIGVYNMVAPRGTPGVFGFALGGAATHIYASVRTGEDYGITLAAKNAPETLAFEGVTFNFWGVPADSSHDAERFCPGTVVPGCPSTAPAKAFTSVPTSCGDAVEASIDAVGWGGGSDSASVFSHDNGEPFPNPIGFNGCNAVDFSPSLQARPTTNVADAPSGLDVDLHIPQNSDPNGTAEAHLREATVTLPEGLVVNPSSANGLDGCSPAEADLQSKVGSKCPDASKLGTVQVDTPVLADPLPGAVYLADPYDNPFNSLLALYVSVDDPQSGVVIKLAGQVHTDPSTGRVSATFKDNPQLPFEDFKLHFFGGAGGSLRTPAVCGSYSTTSSMTPWSAPESGPPAIPSDTYAISQASGGGSCASSDGARPHTPDLDAGTVSPIAGAYSPMVINLRREDGSQQFSTVTLSPPPGLIGKLAGTPYCSESALAAAASKAGAQEKASPSCPAASALGTVNVAAGAGPAPYQTQGIAYLSGAYKGAPLSLAIVTPATAGPFDLGTVVVRTALRVDPESAQITAISDPIPEILQGIPLDVRSAQIKLDRPSFTLNPTSCDPLAFSGSLLSTLGQAAPLAERFQVGECGRLAFKPKLAIKLLGGTKRGAHPALRATLTMPPGSANIAKASVALPHSEFLDQAHIGTVCTRVQFAADECPAASVYGHAKASSPLVDYTVEGPVYLRSSSHKLPDLVMALHGPPSQPLEVDAVARIDAVKGGIRSTFEAVPDVPLNSVVLEMAGAKKGLLQNSTNICKGKHLAKAEFEAQNGKAFDFKPALKAQCKSARKKSKRHHRADPRAVR